jgi:hypothetical protein
MSTASFPLTRTLTRATPNTESCSIGRTSGNAVSCWICETSSSRGTFSWDGAFRESRLLKPKEQPRIETTEREIRTASCEGPTMAPLRTKPDTSKGNTRERGAQSRPKVCVKTPGIQSTRAKRPPAKPRPAELLQK